MNEKAKNDFDNRIDVLSELKKSIENFNANANANENQINFKGITSQKFIKKYGVLKFPQLFFFRNGNYVNYKGATFLISDFNETVIVVLNSF